MKIFQAMGDDEWWIGEDADSVLAEIRDVSGGEYTDEEIGVEELPDAMLDRMTFLETTEEDHSTESGHVERTFREQLARELAEGGAFPRLFASTYY